MSDTKKIVWCLFDDGDNSYHKVLQLDTFKEKFEHYSIGINNCFFDEYRKIDLSILNKNLIKELHNLPRPDIIIASPPCESWSVADSWARIYKVDENNNIQLRDKKYYTWLNEKAKSSLQKRDFFQKEQGRLIGESTVAGLMRILNTFSPKVWVIENPTSSLIWKWINYRFNIYGIPNNTYYNNYDLNFSQKPTTFLSNIELDLTKKRIKSGVIWEKRQGYNLRSSIPFDLVKHIFYRIYDYLNFYKWG